MRKLLVALAVLAFVPAASVQADSIAYLGTGFGMWGIEIMGPNGIHYGPGGFAGQIRLQDTTTGGSPFAGYCLDASQYLQDPQQMAVLSLADPAFATGGNPTNARPNTGGKVAWLLNTYGGQVTNGVSGAALQMAIWEVLYEAPGSYNVAAGNFRWVNANNYGATATLANTWLGQLGSNTSNAVWLDTNHGQDFGVPVPEPGSMLLLGTGLIGLAAMFRRPRRK